MTKIQALAIKLGWQKPKIRQDKDSKIHKIKEDYLVTEEDFENNYNKLKYELEGMKNG